MTSLMNDGLAQVIADDGATGHRVSLHVAAVHDEGGHVAALADRRSNRRRQRAAAEDVAGQVGLEVDVERGVGPLAQVLLHLDVVVLDADGPGIVDGPGGIDEIKVDAVLAVRAVHLFDLRAYHRFGNLSFLGLGRDDVEVRRNLDGVLAAHSERGGSATRTSGAPCHVGIERLGGADEVGRSGGGVGATVKVLVCFGGGESAERAEDNGRILHSDHTNMCFWISTCLLLVMWSRVGGEQNSNNLH